MDKKRNNFLDGLVLGAAIGSVAVFLLGTKRGREIFNLIKEEGRERFGKLEEMFSEYQEAMHEEEMEEEQEPREHKKLAEKTPEHKEEKPKVGLRKRLFRGAPKRKS